MSIMPTKKPLRLWPGVALACLLIAARYVAPAILPDALFIGVFGGLIGAVAIVLWWLLLSRARWFERLGALALMAAGLILTKRIVDISIATGAQGFLFWFLALPPLSLAL